VLKIKKNQFSLNFPKMGGVSAPNFAFLAKTSDKNNFFLRQAKIYRSKPRHDATDFEKSDKQCKYG